MLVKRPSLGRAICVATSAAILGLVNYAVIAQSTLSPAVQAELLRDKIYAQANANDADGILVSLDQYHTITRDSALAFPVPLLWIEAKAAHEAGDATRALSALQGFLNSTDSNADHHKEALTLYTQYQQEAGGAKERQKDARRQALIARIPEVIQQIGESMVTIPEGLISCRAKQYSCQRAGTFRRETKVSGFSISKTCVTNFWWDVYAADVGRKSYDDYEGGGAVASHCIGTKTLPIVDLDKPLDKIDKWTLDHTDVITESDVRGFVSWLSRHDGSRWRLPSEAELELAIELIARSYPRELSKWAPSREERLLRSVLNVNDCGEGMSCDKYLDSELVGDCWHSNLGSAPQDGAVWSTDCSSPKPAVLTFKEYKTQSSGTNINNTFLTNTFTAERQPFPDDDIRFKARPYFVHFRVVRAQ